jgi:hypothetical protein
VPRSPSTIPALLVAALLVAVATAAAASAAGRGELGGRFSSTLGYRIAGENEVSERDFLLDLEGRWEWGRGWEIRVLGRGRYEDRLEPDTYHEAELREAVLTRRGKSYTAALGRQQVVWGKADGLRLLDVVNPLDLREFLLDDYADSRIPLWMANLELFRGEHSFQLLVIPDLTFDRLAAPGAEFFVAPSLPPDLLAAVGEIEAPARRAENWEYGFKWSALLGRLDLTVNAFDGWSDSPVPFHDLSPIGLEVRPRIVRNRLFGLAGDLPIGPAVLRFEATMSPDGYLQVAPPGAAGGFARHQVWRHAVGVDWIRRNWLVSPQWFQEWVVDPDPRLLENPSRSYLTLLVRRSWRQDRLTLRLFYAYGLEDGDEWLSPRISYQLFGRLELALGADLLDGEPAGSFGRFADRDRLTLETTVRF